VGSYTIRAGRGPPPLLLGELKRFEQELRRELVKDQPNIGYLQRRQEEIEDVADGFDVSIIWGGFSKRDMYAELTGSSFGYWHMPNVVPKWRR
jgi:hypothetical protein